MIVSDSKEFIFIHNPKCAGNTIRALLSPYETRGNFFWGIYQPFSSGDSAIHDIAHLTITGIRTVLGEPVFRSYYKFCVVRNPYDRTYSAFQESLKYFPEFRGMEYGKFLKEVLVDLKIDTHRTVHFTPQYLFVHDVDYVQQVDKVCRLEKLSEELAQVDDVLGLELSSGLDGRTEGKAAGSDRYRYMDKYDRTGIHIVNKVYSKDFELLGYDILDEPLK